MLSSSSAHWPVTRAMAISALARLFKHTSWPLAMGNVWVRLHRASLTAQQRMTTATGLTASESRSSH